MWGFGCDSGNVESGFMMWWWWGVGVDRLFRMEFRTGRCDVSWVSSGFVFLWVLLVVWTLGCLLRLNGMRIRRVWWFDFGSKFPPLARISILGFWGGIHELAWDFSVLESWSKRAFFLVRDFSSVSTLRITFVAVTPVSISSLWCSNLRSILYSGNGGDKVVCGVQVVRWGRLLMAVWRAYLSKSGMVIVKVSSILSFVFLFEA